MSGDQPPGGDAAAATRSRERARLWLLGVAGLAAGVALAGTVIAVRERSTAAPAAGPSGLGPRPSAEAAAALVTAMRRSRTATFSLVEEFRRTAPSGVEVVATQTVRVQRPPDSLVRTDQAVDRVVGGVHTACATAPGSAGSFQCRSEPAAPVDVEAAVAEQAALLTGTAPLYTVAALGVGCFALVLRVERTAPPHGRRATLCYDEATGAPSRSEVTKATGAGAEVVDRTLAFDIRGSVTDADLALPPGAVETTG